MNIKIIIIFMIIISIFSMGCINEHIEIMNDTEITKNVSEIILNENDLLKPQTAEYWSVSEFKINNTEKSWTSTFYTNNEMLENKGKQYSSIDEAKQKYIELNRKYGEKAKLTPLKYGDESFGITISDGFFGTQCIIVIMEKNIITTLNYITYGYHGNLNDIKPYAKIISKRIN